MPTPIPDRLPLDILHVSDTHFRGWWNEGRHAHWKTFVSNVETLVKQRRDFSPALIAFTGDLVESGGLWSSRRAFHRGVDALLDLCHACGFIDDPPPGLKPRTEYSIPDVWWSLLGTRLLIVPGNHDVFVKGLRAAWQRWPHQWRCVSSQTPPANGSLIPEGSLRVGPLAVRLIDTNGQRAFFKRARGVYEARDGGGSTWPAGWSNPASPLGVAIMHAHPLQLPYLIEGLGSEAGMMCEHSGILLKELAELGIRLILHGHRHLPNVCSVTVPTSGGGNCSIAIVAAPSVTCPAEQWPHFGYNWIRIEPDRRVSVYLMRRAKGEDQFHPVENSGLTADRGDFEYDSISRSTQINESGDLLCKVSVRGFRVRADRPPVAAIPFSIRRPQGAMLACTRLTAQSSNRVSGPSVTWDEAVQVLKIHPPHDANSDPLDLDIDYGVHNHNPLSKWEAVELARTATAADATSIRTSCATRLVELSVQLPQSFATYRADQFAFRHRTGSNSPRARDSDPPPVEWDPVRRIASVRKNRPRPGDTFSLEWQLPGGEPTAESEASVQPVRAVQARLAKAHREGKRLLNGVSRDLAQTLAPTLGAVDVCVFVACTSEVRSRDTASSLPRLALVGEHPESTGSVTELSYGQGVAGRAQRLGKTVLYSRLVANETRRQFEQGELKTPSDNYYAPGTATREHEVLVTIPVGVERLKTTTERMPPSRVALVACIGSNDPNTLLLKLVSDETRRAAELSSMEQLVRERLHEWMDGALKHGLETGDVADDGVGHAQGSPRTQPAPS